MASTVGLSPSRSNRRVLAAIVGVLLASVECSAERQPENTSSAQPERVVSAPVATTAHEAPKSPGVPVDEAEEPPVDHDPHVIIRPAVGGRQLHPGPETALIYVNSIGRPTVINLATGDQYEVDIADTRATDSILVERGEIVASRDLSNRALLTLATERATPFTIVRGLPAADGRRDPVLCAYFPCGPDEGHTGRVERVGESIAVRDAPGTVIDSIASMLGAPSANVADRFSTLELADGSYRLPTPGRHAVLWVTVDE